jgi:hypothetical protein
MTLSCNSFGGAACPLAPSHLQPPMLLSRLPHGGKNSYAVASDDKPIKVSNSERAGRKHAVDGQFFDCLRAQRITLGGFGQRRNLVVRA